MTHRYWCDDLLQFVTVDDDGMLVRVENPAPGEICSVEALSTGPLDSAPEAESILQEAHRLTHGPRRKDYGHPLDDYSRTAALVNALLAHKLREPLTASDAALVMCCVKLSRQVNAPKRDNMTDLAGYAWVAQECLDEEARRVEADSLI